MRPPGITCMSVGHQAMCLQTGIRQLKSAVPAPVHCRATPGLTSGQYRWWIQTWNNVGYGPWSSGLNFSVP